MGHQFSHGNNTIVASQCKNYHEYGRVVSAFDLRPDANQVEKERLTQLQLSLANNSKA